MGRNVLTSPGLRQWDFSVARSWAIREGHRLEFRFEFFNFANHPNWNDPGTNPREPVTFGVVNSARTMREQQFALKYLFRVTAPLSAMGRPAGFPGGRPFGAH